MNFKVIRRGFTVVEIVIVIAVIAVLAGVMVPTISNIVKKAQQSVDEQLVNNLNKILMAEEVIEGKNPYMHAAVLDLAENGYDLDSLKMIDEDNILVWDQYADRFLIANISGETVNRTYCNEQYFEEYPLTRERFLWKIFTSEDYIDGKLSTQQKFSIYWGETTEPVIGNNGVFDIGFDVGEFDGVIDFTDKGIVENIDWLAFNTSNIIIRGNFNSIVVNAAGIKHFGMITKILYLNLNSYYEHWWYRNDSDYAFHEYGYVEKVMMSQSKTSLDGNYILSTEQGAKFKQSLDEIKGIVGGESHFKNNGAEFGVSF